MAEVPRRTRTSRKSQIEALRARQIRLEREEFVAQDHCLGKLRRAAKWARDAATKFGDPELAALAAAVKARYFALAEAAWRAAGGDPNQPKLPFDIPPVQEPDADNTVAADAPVDEPEGTQDAHGLAWGLSRHE